MVMDRPTRGVPGGAGAGVGAVSQTVADRLAASRELRPSIWLERGGRLRCVASTGEGPVRDGISPTAGVKGATFTSGVESVVGATFSSGVESVVGATFSSGVESVVPDAAAHRGAASRPRLAAQACLPIRADGLVVGVLDVALARPLRAGDLEHLREAADELGRAVAAAGGPPAESPAQRMLRHMTTLSSLDEPDAIARALLPAALDVMALDSAVLVRRDRHVAPEPGAPAGAGAELDDDERAALRPVAAVGPLGGALTGLSAGALQAIEGAVHDGAAGVVVATAVDLARPELEPLHAAGGRSLVAVSLLAHAETHGLLLLAGTAERAVSVDDVELLELLAAHAATCLRTADLMRSLREQAATDPLTGLGHHATFHATLANAHRRPSTAVVLVDVDGFKRLNDTFGHQYGDRVLRELAGALTGALRRGDTLFRIGGDEFAALLLVSDAAEALEAGRRLRAAVADAGLGVTVSIGVAVPQEGETDACVLGRADRALYRVKGDGRDGVALADDEPAAVTPPL
jgi:diguanylate cyclase (GGDEF)-like protein